MGSLQGEKRYGFGAAACAGRNSGEGCFCVLESSLAARSLWIQMGAFSPQRHWTALLALMVKNLPAVHETQGPSLGWEDPLEKPTATHSCILPWRTPWTEEPGGLQHMGS